MTVTNGMIIVEKNQFWQFFIISIHFSVMLVIIGYCFVNFVVFLSTFCRFFQLSIVFGRSLIYFGQLPLIFFCNFGHSLKLFCQFLINLWPLFRGTVILLRTLFLENCNLQECGKDVRRYKPENTTSQNINSVKLILRLFVQFRRTFKSKDDRFKQCPFPPKKRPKKWSNYIQRA